MESVRYIVQVVGSTIADTAITSTAITCLGQAQTFKVSIERISK